MSPQPVCFHSQRQGDIRATWTQGDVHCAVSMAQLCALDLAFRLAHMPPASVAQSHLSTAHLSISLCHHLTLSRSRLPIPSHMLIRTLHIPLCRAELLSLFTAGLHRIVSYPIATSATRAHHRQPTGSTTAIAALAMPPAAGPCCRPMLDLLPMMDLTARPRCRTLLSGRWCLLLVSIGPH